MKTLYLPLVCILTLMPSAKADSGDPPMNVLLLVSDDLNSWMLNNPDRYTGKVIASNLRKFMRSGVNFTQAYTAAPVCSPSRTAFFSGVAPWKSGHYHNTPGVSESQALSSALSLAGAFKQAGYSTAGYGKITHGWDQKENWDVKLGHKRDPAPPGAPLTVVGRGEQDWGPIHLAEEDMNDSMNADAAIARLQLQHDKPFFIAYGTFNPHMPWYVPQKYFDMFPLTSLPTPKLLTGDLDDVPPLGVELTQGKGKFVDAVLENGLHKEAVQAYLATTAYVDVQMGRVLDALESSPHADNTIVVYITDHGFHLAEKHHWQKATLWEEATHVLMTIRVPGTTARGQICERFVSLLDLYPTLVDLCVLSPKSDLSGRSLVPLLKDSNAEWQSTAITGLTSKGGPTWKPYISIRSAAGRYTRYLDGEEEFYDCANDPHEWTNQIDNPTVAATIDQLRSAVPTLVDMATPLPNRLESRQRKRGQPRIERKQRRVKQ
ncbi:MAG: sulfatase [Fuerstiella sp.]